MSGPVPEDPFGPRRLLPVLVLLFVGSGCAALIYEVVWFQLLELVIGSSAVSMGVLLGTFMGGMCVGSLLAVRVVPSSMHPLRVYAWLELGIAAMGVANLLGMPVLGGAYSAWAGGGASGIAVRAAAAAICLLPPTFLMGATLPVIARWVDRTPDGIAWLGYFYGGNTAGAVAGSLLAGFVLLAFYDITVATFVAVALNVTVAVVGFAAARQVAYVAPAAASERSASAVRPRRVIYVVAALSGLTALACEVIWTRLLSLLIGATTYTFALVLAVFLAGLGIGSRLGVGIARRQPRADRALGWCQLALCLALAWTSYWLTQSMPFWPIVPSRIPNPWVQFGLDLLRSMLAIMPGAVLWGASFPLALAAMLPPPVDRMDGDVATGDPAPLVAGIYAANTLGAIIGSLGASLLLIAWVGTAAAQQLLIVVAACSGLVLLSKSGLPAKWLAALGAGALLLTLSIRPLPGIFVAYGRNASAWLGQVNVIYVGEGWNAAVAVSERENGVRNYHNAGKVQASSEPQDMRLQRMLGHLTTLVAAEPRTVVVIGCGAGVTAGAVSIDPAVERETIAEIEPLVPRVVSRFFSAHNFDVIRNPKVNVHLDDARHFLLTTDQRFDAITSDPLDPWVKGAAMLYTREFFELVKQRLNPGGVVTIFVQLYESNREAVQSEIATFFEAFPKGMVFSNTVNGQGYDLVLLGQVEGTAIDLDEMEARLQRPEYAAVRQSLAEIGMTSAVDLFATYAGSAEDLRPWLQDADINTDRNLRLQYLAGRGFNLYRADAIYAEMVAHASDPRGTFGGSDALKASLVEKIRIAQGR